MVNSTISKQKAEYINAEITIRGKSEYVQLKYKRLDGPNPGVEQTTGAFVASLDQKSRDLIKAKGQFVVVKTKQGDYWNLTSVEDISTYVEKPQNSYISRPKSYETKGSTSTYNTAGVKVGAVLHDAVALVGVGSTTKAVKKIAEELLVISYELEENVNNGKYKSEKEGKSDEVNITGTSTPPSIGNLEDIDF